MSRSISHSVVLFLSLLISSNLCAADLPSPEGVIGFKVGADSKLADWEAIHRYFRELDAASERVSLEVIGRSTTGKDMLLAVVTSKVNMARQREIKESLRRLADPRTLSEEDAERLIATTPVAVFVGCAQHATEIGSTQMSMELAYRLAAEDTPEMERIRKHAVLLLVPSMNPDGHQMVCDWYNEHLGTPFEGGYMPWLYHKYVGHDNNRDWAMITQAESLNISRILYEEWFPQIVIDVHQMGRSSARMFIPPYYDPVNPNIDPLIDHELRLICAQMRLDLSAAGHRGVISNSMFDEWLLGYFTSVPSRHNMVSHLIEMASVNIASPMFIRPRDLRGSRGSDYARTSNFPEPWEGGWWRLRDIVEYEETAIFSTLGLAARSRDMFLRNFHSLGVRQIEAGEKEPPYAFLVPPGQDDPATAWKMLVVLMRGGVEIHEAVRKFEADGVEYPPGTQVILMAQPYRAHAKDLLEKQVYPELRTYPGGPSERPYDVTGWTLSLLMGVKTVEVVNPFEAELRRVQRRENPPQGRILGQDSRGRYLLIERSQNNAYILVNRLLKEGSWVQTFVEETEAEGRKFPAGTLIIGGAGGGEDVEKRVRSLGIDAYACSELPEGARMQVRPVKLGLYKPWTASMDEGWTRWVLEQFEFPFQSLHDAEIRAGGLIDRYDVILLPDLRSSSIVRGRAEGSMPKQYTGGIGEQGVFALRDFVRDGGTIVALDSSCSFLIDTLELPVQLVPTGDGDKRFSCPGSVLRINVDVNHPLAFGLRPATAVMFSNSPAFEPKKPDKDKEKDKERGEEEKEKNAAFVGRYPRMNPLMSGWIENDEVIRGKGALVQAEFGDGKAVLIGFRAQFRAQPHGTFKVLFNAILSAGQVGLKDRE